MSFPQRGVVAKKRRVQCASRADFSREPTAPPASSETPAAW